MIIAALLTTALMALLFGLLPAGLAGRQIRGRDLGWTIGLWLVVWLFALCAYHRPGITVGFDGFRLAALTAMTGWAGLCTAGLRHFRTPGHQVRAAAAGSAGSRHGTVCLQCDLLQHPQL